MVPEEICDYELNQLSMADHRTSNKIPESVGDERFIVREARSANRFTVSFCPGSCCLRVCHLTSPRRC